MPIRPDGSRLAVRDAVIAISGLWRARHPSWVDCYPRSTTGQKSEGQDIGLGLRNLG
jgi:hypothetical protein